MLKSGNPYYQGPTSDHFDGRQFFNPGGVAPQGLKALLRWQFGGGKARWPKRYDSPFAGAKPDDRVNGNGMRVTMIGHATVLIQVAGINILTDPVWSDRASPVGFIGPRRVNAPGVSFDVLPKIDVVLITHNHYDHLDLTTLALLHRRDQPLIAVPLGNDTLIERAIPEARLVALDWGDGINIADGVSLDATPCHHWSARGPFDRRMALWCAFLINTPAGRIYHVGDTGFHDGSQYRTIRDNHGALRLAILPIGAYEPRWFMKAHHQNPQEAVEGMMTCGAAHAVGHHWGTFRLTDEAVDAPEKALANALAAKGIAPARFQALRPGAVFDVPETAATL